MDLRKLYCSILSSFLSIHLFANVIDHPAISHCPSSEFEKIEENKKSAYLAKRKQWLNEEATVNFSQNVRLTAEEIKLDTHIKKIVNELQAQFLTSNQFCPSRNFLSIKKCIETSPLFSILRRMPKGGVLHLHTSSAGDATWLVNRAIKDENIYIYMDDNGTFLKGTMCPFVKEKVPPGFKLMRSLAEKDPQFVSHVVDMITMTPEDSSSPNPWNKFEGCFSRIQCLIHYAPIFIEYYKHAFEELAKDHIQIVELRADSSGFNKKHTLDGTFYNPAEVIQIFHDIVQYIRKTHPDFILKLIISDIRDIDSALQRKTLETAYKLRSAYPDFIVGYDLVGFETTGHTTLFYLDNLLSAASDLSKKYQTTLPYFFHDGESNWANDLNLFDAVLLKTKRIGHGFNLFHFPFLMQRVKESDICLEICPISNQILGYVNDLRMHPAIGYLRSGLPCVLSSDDPMLFKTTGLSYDFWEAIMAWDLSLADIKKLCINSIYYSALDKDEKNKAFASWEKSWNFFVNETLADLQ